MIQPPNELLLPVGGHGRKEAAQTKGETTMEESLKMLVEYVLERCTGLEGENRRLNKIATAAQETKEQLYDEGHETVKEGHCLEQLPVDLYKRF